MSLFKVIYLFFFIIQLSSQQCNRNNQMKWCLEPKYVVENKKVDINTCKLRPCIIGTCPFGQMNFKKGKKPTCVPMTTFPDVDFSEILSLYTMKSGKPVKTGKFLNNADFQMVLLENRRAHLNGNNNCTSAFINIGEKELINGHFLENGSFLLKNTILPAGEYIVRFAISDVNGTLKPVLKLKFAKDEESTDADVFLDKVFAYAPLVSVVFMVLLLVVYVLCKELRSTGGLILMTYVAVLAMNFLLLVIRQLSLISSVIDSNGCYILSVLIHFFSISSYFWMNLMSFDIWWTLSTMFYGKSFKKGVDYVKYLRYCCIASVPPLLYVIAEVYVEEFTEVNGPKFKDCNACSNKWFVIGLVLPLQTLNFILFVLTVFNLWRIQKSIRDQLNNANSGSIGPVKQNALLIIKMFLIMGLDTWFMDVMVLIFSNYMPDWFKYTAKTYNTLFGLTLFLVYIIKWDVLLKLFRRFSIDNAITRYIERRVLKHHSSRGSLPAE